MRQKLTELNAGSMADIAFLLLVFFLLVTLIPEDDQGILTRLPDPTQDPEPWDIPERNALVIELQPDGSVLVEDQPGDMSDLHRWVKLFYTNSGVTQEAPAYSFLPTRKVWNEHSIAEYVAAAETREEVERRISRADQYRANLRLLGSCRVMPNNSVIYFSAPAGCEYADYIAAMDEVEFVLNELRDSVAMHHFGMNVQALTENQSIAEIKAVRSVLPRKLVEKEMGK